MNHDSNKYAEDFSRYQKRQKVADEPQAAYAAASENSSVSDENDTYGDEDDSEMRNSATYPSGAVGPDGLPMHHNYPKDKGNRKRIPAPMWLQAGGPKRHSDVQLQSGENLTNLKRKYKQSLCLYCAEFNKKSPWATPRSRKYEHEIFNKHEKSKHHQQALSELNKSSFGIAENSEVAAYTTESDFTRSGMNQNVMSHAMTEALANNLSSVNQINNLNHNSNNGNTSSESLNNYSNSNSNNMMINNNVNNTVNSSKNRSQETNNIKYNNNGNNGNINSSSSSYSGEPPAHEHALMLAAIANGGNMPGYRSQAQNTNSNIYLKRTKNIRPFIESFPPYDMNLPDNNYNNNNNSSSSHIHDYDHDTYSGSDLIRNNASSYSSSDNNSGNNSFPVPNIYQNFNSFYNEVNSGNTADSLKNDPPSHPIPSSSRSKSEPKVSKGATLPPDWLEVSGDLVHSDALLSSDRPLEGVSKKHRYQCCLLCAEFSPKSPWAALKSRRYDPDTWDEHTHSLSHTTALTARDVFTSEKNNNRGLPGG